MAASAADSVIDLYQSHAAAWARLRRGDLIEQRWLDAFLAVLPPQGARVADMGCGSGKPIAGYLIANGCLVTGVDGAAALIAQAREYFPEHTWITADMRALPALGPFDGLVAWHSFFHLPPEDQRLMFETFNHLTLPGAPLLFTSGMAHGEVIGRFEGQPLYHASLDAAEYNSLLKANGFEVIEHIEADPACGDATIWLARKVDVEAAA